MPKNAAFFITFILPESNIFTEDTRLPMAIKFQSEVNGMKFAVNKKYKLKQDLTDASLGKIPEGMTVTLASLAAGSCKFKLANGKQFTLPQAKALTVMQE